MRQLRLTERNPLTWLFMPAIIMIALCVALIACVSLVAAALKARTSMVGGGDE